MGTCRDWIVNLSINVLIISIIIWIGKVHYFVVLFSVLNSLFTVVNLRINLNHAGEELKPGSKVSYNAGQGYVIHLSQVYRVHSLSLHFSRYNSY